VQKEPVEGAPAVNDSRVWLLYDNDALYVGAINYDDDPPGIARNMAPTLRPEPVSQFGRVEGLEAPRYVDSRNHTG